MGCASSKRIEAAAVDVYRPPPSSIALFDVTSIQEPWLHQLDKPPPTDDDDGDNINNTVPPPPLLDKLRKFESAADLAPRSWDEVSKDLEHLKPTIKPKPPSAAAVNPPTKSPSSNPTPMKRQPRRSFSFHTLEELDTKSSAMRKSESARNIVDLKQAPAPGSAAGESRHDVIVKPVRENIFIVRDRMEREKEGKGDGVDGDRIRRDPLSDFPEKCPPGGAEGVVIYTTSLRGVRKTYDACSRVVSLMELHGVATDERDVSLHSGFLNEVRELVGAESSESAGSLCLPRVFIKGRYVGGGEEVEALNESGRLGRLLRRAGVERGGGGPCQGCGGARFVPCLKCGGSCKVFVDGVNNKGRCGECNENGLLHCPLCH